jgi:protein-disulfide isomerase
VLLGEVPADCPALNGGSVVKAWILAAMVITASLVSARADEFTPAQRAEIVRIIREAMEKDPSILRDAMAAMQADNDAKYRAELLASPAGMVAGNPKGTVTVVEFYDTRCPYCRKMVPDIASLLRSDPKVRWIYKDFPILGANSVIEAKALVAADRQGGYAKLQALFMKQGGTETTDNIAMLAGSVGLDGKKLLVDMNDPAVAAAINTNLTLGNNLNITGTPAFVIGDKLVPGALDLDDLRKLVAAEE